MPVGAAVGVGALAAGTGLVGAKMGSNASRDAARIQAQSADKAQGFNQQVFDYQKQITQPYIQNGQTSLSNLMAQHWGGTPEQYGMPPTGPRSVGGGMTAGAQRSLGGFAGPQGGGMVQMRAPDGSVRPVPQQLVEKYRAKGAQVVN